MSGRIFGAASKIGDLGCSSTSGTAGPRDIFRIPGDRGYAPIELYYNPAHRQSFDDRRAADLYQVGSLIFFHFGGVSALSALRTARHRIAAPLTNDFAADLPIWKQAFAYSLYDLYSAMIQDGIPNEIASMLISIAGELCEPDPALRGNRKMRNARANERLRVGRHESRFRHLERLVWIHGR